MFLTYPHCTIVTISRNSWRDCDVCADFNFPGESELLQVRRKDQHPPPSSPHRLQRPEHHRGDSRAAGRADPQPRSRAPGHRPSSPDRPNQVREQLFFFQQFKPSLCSEGDNYCESVFAPPADNEQCSYSFIYFPVDGAE